MKRALPCGISSELGDGSSRRASRWIPETSALLFALASPEAVFTVVSCPAATRKHDLTVVAVGAGERLALCAAGAPFSGRGEEQIGFVFAQAVGRPLSVSRYCEQFIKHLTLPLEVNLALKLAFSTK